MNRSLTVNLFALTFLQIFSFYCTEPVSIVNEVDPLLIGEWYYMNTSPAGSLSPDTLFFGMQITGDKKIHSLGIETATGKVAVMERTFYRRLLKAEDGIIITEIIAPPGLITDTSFYKIENKELRVTNSYSLTEYNKTRMGEKLLKPTVSELSLKIDSLVSDNYKIFTYPSAYVKRESPEGFELSAEIKFGFIRIKINNFSGEGDYEIPFGAGELTYNGGDYLITYLSDSVSTGSISINHYDEIYNTCSGTFFFNAGTGYTDTLVHKVKDGVFTVPIYR